MSVEAGMVLAMFVTLVVLLFTGYLVARAIRRCRAHDGGDAEAVWAVARRTGVDGEADRRSAGGVDWYHWRVRLPARLRARLDRDHHDCSAAVQAGRALPLF